MNTSPLEYVLAVIRCKSFSKAAASIPISQQGLSKSIAKLERDLGIAFFRRVGRLVEPTDEAMELLPYIEQLVEVQGDFLAKATSLRGTRAASEQRVTVYSSAFFALGMLKDLDDVLAARGFPRSTILEAETAEAISAIKSSPADAIGIVNVPLSGYDSLPDDGSVAFEELFSSQLAVMASPKFFPPRKKTLSARDVKSLPLSYPNYPVLSDMANELFDHYHPENIVFRTSNVAKVDKSVLAGESTALTDTVVAHLHRGETDRVFLKFDYPVYSNVGFLFASCEEGMDARRGYMDAIAEYMDSLLGAYIRRNPPRNR